MQYTPNYNNPMHSGRVWGRNWVERDGPPNHTNRLQPPSWPSSYPGQRSSIVPVVRHIPSSWSDNQFNNEDFGNLQSQGFGSPYQGSQQAFGSPSSEICCSPSFDGEWVSPMDDQPLYVSPKMLQSQAVPNMLQNNFQNHQNYVVSQAVAFSDSDDETISMQHTPESSNRQNPKNPPKQEIQKDIHMFDMEMDEPSAVGVDDEETFEEDETIDEEVVDEPLMDSLDTTIDYSFLNGALESPLELHEVPVTLNTSKTPCLDALAFCVVMRLGAYQTPQNEETGSIIVSNCEKFLGGIHLFCPKKSQTQNDEARIKALKRWFDGIPAKRKRDSLFVMKAKERKIDDVKLIMKKIQSFCISQGLLPAKDPATQLALCPSSANHNMQQ